MSRPAFVQIPVRKVTSSSTTDTDDVLAAEEPVEIRLEYGPSGSRTQKSISVTMRTPGNDMELAAGFLYTEGIISSVSQITDIKHFNGANENVVRVSLHEHVQPDMQKLDRHFYTTSSCGVCGKSSIEAVMTVCNVITTNDTLRIPSSLIYELPDKLRREQEVFEHTGGLHGCALFDTEGNLLLVREDVGRHNAVDKLVGAALNMDMLPLQEHILLLSGRASFELVQKATMAGIKIIVAIGAPSTLAVQMSEAWGITLIGFLRGERYNIYTGTHRVIM